jgi:hypothetical protein
MRLGIVIKDRFGAALFLVAALAGCGAATPSASVEQNVGTLTLSLPGNGRALDATRRYTNSRGAVIPGIKVQGAQRTYWLPVTARMTKDGDDLLVFAYHSLFVFPRRGVKVVDNASSAVHDQDGYDNEAIPGALILRDKAKENVRKHRSSSANSRSSHYVNQNTGPTQLGNCDVWDPNCICPDCSGASSPWDERPPQDFVDLFTPDYVYPDPTEECLLLSGDDPTSYAACMEAGGPNFIKGFGTFFRSNARGYDFYSGNDATVLFTVDNPVAKGARYVTWFYNGLLDNPDQEIVPVNVAANVNASYMSVAVFYARSGVFSQMQTTWTADFAQNAVEVNSARIAVMKLASWIRGMGASS